ncbi:MAG: hypothetical protein H6807_05080 [Planctomycetes bacterium]|nr:hypothetical protein [Planctomycetota bacterium]
MARDRLPLVAVTLLAITAGLIFLIFLEGGPDLLDAGRGPGVAEEATQPLETGGPRRRSELRPVLESPATEATDPDLPPDDPIEYPAEALFSGDARATFEIRDAHDRPLPAEIELRAWLHRLESGTRIHEGVRVDQERKTLHCVGEVGSGLEPGRYALRYQAGPYGGGWKDFELGRGQLLSECLRVATWSRVIKLRFVDRDGRPIPRLAVAPSYSASDLRVPDRKLPDGPGLLLREPPGYVETDNIFIGGGGSGGSFGARRGSRAWATQDGCWFLRVVAGGEGKLHVSLSAGRDGCGPIDVSGAFLEPDWDDHLVVLDPTETQRSRLARFTLANAEDPGNQSVLDLRTKSAREPDPLDFGTETPVGWSRVVFRGPEIPHLALDVHEPDFGSSVSHFERRYRDRAEQEVEGVWYSDIAVGRDLDLAWSWDDGALLRTTTRKRGRSELPASGQLQEIEDRFGHLPFAVRLGSLGPTLDAWARGLTLDWADEERYRPGPRRALRDDDGFRIETAVPLDENGRPLFRARLELTLSGDARWSRRSAAIAWTAAMSEAARRGLVELEPELSGLALRALDEEGRALPWVEASLMEASSLPVALRVRSILAEGGVDVSLETGFLVDDLDRIALSALRVGSDISGLERHVGEKLWQALGDDAARLHVGHNGAWYDPWRKMRGDDRGYIIDLGERLVPGRRYVLWLWSRSRDVNRPDRMLVFTAREGVTDLGLVRLPRWPGP